MIPLLTTAGRIVAVLEAHPDWTNRQIARKTWLTEPTVTNTVLRLVGAGIVLSEPNGRQTTKRLRLSLAALVKQEAWLIESGEQTGGAS